MDMSPHSKKLEERYLFEKPNFEVKQKGKYAIVLANEDIEFADTLLEGVQRATQKAIKLKNGRPYVVKVGDEEGDYYE